MRAVRLSRIRVLIREPVRASLHPIFREPTKIFRQKDLRIAPAFLRALRVFAGDLLPDATDHQPGSGANGSSIKNGAYVWFGMLKLQQGQVWKAGDEYLRIVDLQRLEVNYKAMKDLQTREGTHHHVTKKQFCRLIKNATLLEGKPPE